MRTLGFSGLVWLDFRFGDLLFGFFIFWLLLFVWGFLLGLLVWFFDFFSFVLVLKGAIFFGFGEWGICSAFCLHYKPFFSFSRLNAPLTSAAPSGGLTYLNLTLQTPQLLNISSMAPVIQFKFLLKALIKSWHSSEIFFLGCWCFGWRFFFWFFFSFSWFVVGFCRVSFLHIYIFNFLVKWSFQPIGHISVVALLLVLSAMTDIRYLSHLIQVWELNDSHSNCWNIISVV